MWEFAREAPMAVAIMFWVACWAGVQPIKYAYKAYKYRLRARNIALHGWPAPPLDADGELSYPDAPEVDEPCTGRRTMEAAASR